MNFNERLQRAIERGERAKSAQHAAGSGPSESDLRGMHTEFQLQLTDQIEKNLRDVAEQFPGFRYSSILDERGWGSNIVRDDFALNDEGRRSNLFSRLEMTIRKFAPPHVLELNAKAMIRNKELYNRTHYQRLVEVDVDSFSNVIDLWVLEFAERYAASS